MLAIQAEMTPQEARATADASSGWLEISLDLDDDDDFDFDDYDEKLNVEQKKKEEQVSGPPKGFERSHRSEGREPTTTAAAHTQAVIVSEGVAKLLETKAFTTEPPAAHKIFENAEWLRERVVATDRLDSETPLIVVHWSVLKRLGRLPRNPDDAEHFDKAVDVIDNYITGKATHLLVICMVSHRWNRPGLPHPDSGDNAKARALAKYGDAARARNVDMYFWLDYAGVNQENFRDKVVGISKLPCIVASCTEFLIFWSEDYEPRAWTRMERFIGYVLSPCRNFRVIDENYGKPVAMELLTKSGAVVASKISTSPPSLKVTDPLKGKLTSESDRPQLERLVALGHMFPPVAYRGTCSKVVQDGKSKVELIRMAASRTLVGTQTWSNADFVTDIVAVDSRDAEDALFKKAAEDAFTKRLQEELILGFGFTVWWFVLYNLLRSISPMITNGLWVAGAGISHCGGRQSFWTWVFEFEAYFMTLKGIMISCFYWLFMPRPTPRYAYYTQILHVIFTFMMIGFTSMMSFLWVAFGLHDEGTLSWLLFKANFPVGASTAFITFGPLYLCMNYDRGSRWFAMKRYILLTIVHICDVLLITASHAYVFFFNHVMEEWMPEFEDNFVVHNLLQLLLVSGYTLGFMPLLGKVFWFGVLLVDKFAPMNDLQHEWFIYFSTVICDMHRLMYSRELFVNLNSHFLFYLILAKDVNYVLYQFVIKAHPLWQTFIIGMFHPDGMTTRNGASWWMLRSMRVVRCLSEAMECPKVWLSWHRATIDAGFKSTEDAPTTQFNFFCCDTMVQMKNLPSPFSGKFSHLKDMSEKERMTTIRSWVKEANFNVRQRVAPESSTCQSWSGEESTKTHDARTHRRGDDCAWEVAFAGAAHEMVGETVVKSVSTVSNDTSLWSKDGNAKKVGSILGVTWESEFYSYLSLRLNGIIFLRAQARVTVSIATALSYIFTGVIIRSTSAKKVMNSVKDHEEELEMKTFVAGISFLVCDLLMMAILNYYHLRKRKHRIFHLAKFGRIFQSKMLFIMLVICTACCKSDFFLTYPEIKFCGI